MAMSNEEFYDICKNKFMFGAYLGACIKYYNADKYEFSSDMKVNIPEDKRYLFMMLCIVAKTSTGENILKQLDGNIKMDFIVDETEKANSKGYSTDNHLIAITNPERDKFCNALTFIHELTHELQKQQGGNSCLLMVKEDRFTVAKMMEAEARINAAKMATDIGILLYNESGKNACADFRHRLPLRTRTDMIQYCELLQTGMSEEEINREMLKNIYSDENWHRAYKDQLAEAMNYKMSLENYRQSQGKDAEEVKMQYMRRLGLNEKDKEMFFDVQLAQYVSSDYVANKIGKNGINAEIIEEPIGDKKEIFEKSEDSILAQGVLTDKRPGKALSASMVADELKIANDKLKGRKSSGKNKDGDDDKNKTKGTKFSLTIRKTFNR